MRSEAREVLNEAKKILKKNSLPKEDLIDQIQEKLKKFNKSDIDRKLSFLDKQHYLVHNRLRGEYDLPRETKYD